MILLTRPGWQTNPVAQLTPSYSNWEKSCIILKKPAEAEQKRPKGIDGPEHHPYLAGDGRQTDTTSCRKRDR